MEPMTLADLTAAQDAMNAAITQAVNDFLATCPDVTIHHGTINIQYGAEGQRVPFVQTSVECAIDNARITRRAPEVA